MTRVLSPNVKSRLHQTHKYIPISACSLSKIPAAVSKRICLALHQRSMKDNEKRYLNQHVFIVEY